MFSVAFRSVLSPPSGYITKMAPKVLDSVKALNLQVLATAAYRFLKCGGVAKKKAKSKVCAVYELYPPNDVKNERWFCKFIKNIDDKTFLGRWCLANSTTVLDKKYARPVVLEWCSVIRLVQ
jgi:hypothetical protein